MVTHTIKIIGDIDNRFLPEKFPDWLRDFLCYTYIQKPFLFKTWQNAAGYQWLYTAIMEQEPRNKNLMNFLLIENKYRLYDSCGNTEEPGKISSCLLIDMPLKIYTLSVSYFEQYFC